MKILSNTFPTLTELEHEILSVSKEINWLDNQITFFAESGNAEASNDFAGQLVSAIRKLKKLEKLKEVL